MYFRVFTLIFVGVLSYGLAYANDPQAQFKSYLDLIAKGPEVSLADEICIPLIPQKIDRSISTSTIKDKHNKDIEISRISYDYLKEIFNELANLKYIPYDYPEEGCYARAHEMVKFLETKKIYAGKIFLEGDLKVETKNTKKGVVKWWFHVAPIIMVKENNQEQLYVIDPSIFDHPVKIQEWREVQIKHQNMSYKFPKRELKTFFTTRFQYLPNDLDENKEQYDEYFYNKSQKTVIEYSLQKYEDSDVSNEK